MRTSSIRRWDLSGMKFPSWAFVKASKRSASMIQPPTAQKKITLQKPTTPSSKNPQSIVLFLASKQTDLLPIPKSTSISQAIANRNYSTKTMISVNAVSMICHKNVTLSLFSKKAPAVSQTKLAETLEGRSQPIEGIRQVRNQFLQVCLQKSRGRTQVWDQLQEKNTGSKGWA